MADISVTAASVAKATGASTQNATAGEAITAGQVVYSDATNSVKLAQADGTAAEAVAVGIALNNAASGQPITYVVSGGINPGGTVVVGKPYFVSGTAGGIAIINTATPIPAVGDYVTLLGIGTTSSNIALSIIVSGVEVPA